MKAIILYLSVVILTSCVNKASEDDKVEKKTKTMVTLTSPSFGNIREEIVLSGTTTYLRKSITYLRIHSQIQCTDRRHHQERSGYLYFGDKRKPGIECKWGSWKWAFYSHKVRNIGHSCFRSAEPRRLCDRRNYTLRSGGLEQSGI